MANPILQALNLNSNQQANNMANLINMAQRNPQAIFNQMMQNNPKFSQFVRENQGKPADQIAREHGIDPRMLNQFIR